MAGAIPIEPARDAPVPGRIMEPALPADRHPAPPGDPPQVQGDLTGHGEDGVLA